jgi:type IV pilus assembly protein PilA
MLKRFLKNERGLTLIELLAVIVILGIIAAIAIPSITGLINKSKDDAKVAEGIQIINAAKLYMTANNFTPDTGQSYQTLSNTELNDYLDNVKDSGNNYKVRVSQQNGKYVYVLRDHDANTVLNDPELTETEIQNKTKGNGS